MRKNEDSPLAAPMGITTAANASDIGANTIREADRSFLFADFDRRSFVVGSGESVRLANLSPPLDEIGKPAGGPVNLRAELWSNLKKVLEGHISIPDSDSLHADLTVGYKYQSDGRLLLESKDDMRERGMPSPDEGDAAALCFSL